MLNILKRKTKNQIEARKTTRLCIVNKTYVEMLWEIIMRYRSATLEDVDATEIQDVERIYTERFENPADFRFSCLQL